MKNMTLENIALACGGQYVGAKEKKQCFISGAVTDSRDVGQDFLFIAVKGERVDGHQYISAVSQKGALACIVEQPFKEASIPYILVDSSLIALKQIAAFYRQQLAIPVIGITGSVGKTSTKEMIASVLSTKYNVLKTAGNFNNEIGLPLTILRIRKEHEVAVVEMGISDFGEMSRLAEIARPTICVITNIGSAHLENLKDRDGIFAAKTEVFSYLTEGATVILNVDDDKLSAVTQVQGRKPIFYGLRGEGEQRKGEQILRGQSEQIVAEEAEGACFCAKAVKSLGLKGNMAQFVTPEGEMEIRIPLPGEVHIGNALAAAAVGQVLTLTLAEIKQGIEAVQAISGRSHIIEKNGITLIDDCYNANPVSMRAAIDLLCLGTGRTIAVLGDMGELGVKEKQLHYELGAYVASQKVSALFCTGKLAQEIVRGAKEMGGGETYYFDSKEELIEGLKGYAKEGDTLLVKASHFMGFEEVVDCYRTYAPLR
ncbi:UDP-N-acetylmuramoyl-tripeptide--D-alanyl-D-alanine ligase [Clostridia bacterium]|nr:UDP-N-acetylmuramoyl-tripeptide--D-alanyl-D-alanine ligase [Clostridia bacterium]